MGTVRYKLSLHNLPGSVEDSKIEITRLGLSRVPGQWHQQARSVNDSSAKAETRCYKKPDEDRQLQGEADLRQRAIQGKLQGREGMAFRQAKTWT